MRGGNSGWSNVTLSLRLAGGKSFLCRLRRVTYRAWRRGFGPRPSNGLTLCPSHPLWSPHWTDGVKVAIATLRGGGSFLHRKSSYAKHRWRENPCRRPMLTSQETGIPVPVVSSLETGNSLLGCAYALNFGDLSFENSNFRKL